jgi:hypothetical protein
MSKRKLTALSKLYQRPPTNEHLERDFKRDMDFAWLAVAELYNFLEACHKDGILESPTTSVEQALKDLAECRDRLDQDLWCDFELDLPADAPTVAEPAVATVGV